LDGVRPFVRILSEKVRARRGRPPKDEVRLVPRKRPICDVL
ncbi:resolvase, partial [Escherichia coli]|nr:resolvase [Escherichia coli]